MTQNDGIPLLRLHDPGLFFLPSGGMSVSRVLDFLYHLGLRKGWDEELIAIHMNNAECTFARHHAEPDRQRHALVTYLESLL